MAKPKIKGRPKEYNNATLKRICKYIMEGKTLTEIARKLGISRQSIYVWRKENEDFNEMYEIALKVKAESLMDEIIEISDNELRDILIDQETGRQTGNTTAVQRDKLKIMARTKLMQWLDPKRYAIQNIDITSNNESIYGGLVITPPREDGFENEK